MQDVVIALVFIPIGGLLMAASIQDWDWFMTARRARLFVSLFGRKGARIIYGVLGALLLLGGIIALVVAIFNNEPDYTLTLTPTPENLQSFVTNTIGDGYTQADLESFDFTGADDIVISERVISLMNDNPDAKLGDIIVMTMEDGTRYMVGFVRRSGDIWRVVINVDPILLE